MTPTSIPQLKEGDEFMHFGMRLKVESVRHSTKQAGFGADVTQARCAIIAGHDCIPPLYTDDGAGTHYTVQGNEHFRVAVL